MNLKVSTKSDVRKVAGAIVSILEEGKSVSLDIIGAGALNQAVKAVIIARSFTITSGMDLLISPAFANLPGEDKNVTGIKLDIFVKPKGE